MFDSAGLLSQLINKYSIIHFPDNHVELSCACSIQQAYDLE